MCHFVTYLPFTLAQNLKFQRYKPIFVSTLNQLFFFSNPYPWNLVILFMLTHFTSHNRHHYLGQVCLGQ